MRSKSAQTYSPPSILAMQWQGGKTCQCRCIAQFLTWVFSCLKPVHNSTHDELKKTQFPCMHCLPHHPSSNCVNTPPSAGAPLLPTNIPRRTWSLCCDGVVGVVLLSLFLQRQGDNKKNCHYTHLPPHHQSARLECHCLPSGTRRGRGGNATTSWADDERQRQEDRQRHQQTGGRHCCTQTEQQKMTHLEKGIAGCAWFH